jgi:hypothetical protein
LACPLPQALADLGDRCGGRVEVANRSQDARAFLQPSRADGGYGLGRERGRAAALFGQLGFDPLLLVDLVQRHPQFV